MSRRSTSRREEIVSQKQVGSSENPSTGRKESTTVRPAASGLPDDKTFKFYKGWGQYTGVSADGLIRFAAALETVEPASVEFHLQRGDFEKWLTEVVKDPELATRFGRLKSYRGNEAKNNAARAARQRLQELNIRAA
jgi:hypothetical protein